MGLSQSFIDLLLPFQAAFCAPSFQTFIALMTGWALSHRRRFVTELIQSAGCVGKGHHSRYHRFFSKSVWALDELSRILARMLVAAFVPEGIISLAVDDTLVRRRGLKVYGAGMHYDPLISSRAKTLVSWGHDWVVLSLVVTCPFWAPTKVWALPIAFRLYKNRQGNRKGKNRRKAPAADPHHRTRPELAVELIQLVASWFPERELIVTGDSAYGGKSVLRHLPPNVHLISHVAPNGVLYEPAPKPKAGQRGGRRKKGKRHPGMKDWAADSSPWRKFSFSQFGLHATLQVKVKQALYYTAGGERLLTIILTRDVLGQRPDQMFYCTKLDWKAFSVLSTYAGRWSSEVTHQNSKQLMGFQDPANRTKPAVMRTAPMAMILHSLIILWFHNAGHRHLTFPLRPWYRKKTEPSFADMLTTLRRRSWYEKLRGGSKITAPLRKSMALIVNFLARAA